jgi:CRISPR/Cas system-associated exonuclease Cas4 (RecB family)
MREKINKSDWLAALQCPTMGWFGLRAAPEAPNEAELFRMEQGREVGKLARELYPTGILVSNVGGKTVVELTNELIARPSTDTLFEAEFNAGRFVARADILRREQGGWHVLEVKSSFADSSGIKELIDDLAYTVMVLRRSGLQVAKASLILLSRTYLFGQAPKSLFEIHDNTLAVNERVSAFEKMADIVARVLLEDNKPSPVLVSACRNCSFFEVQCIGAGIAHTVLEIPGLHHTKLKRLSANGIIDLSQAPGDLNLNERQERARKAALADNLVVEPGLSAALGSFTWPCHYLDFETVAAVLPVYVGHGCHRQVLTQFSLHHRNSIAAEPSHDEYLADAERDCERELAETLINNLGDRGSIVVYSAFEKTRISVLKDLFPDLAVPLQAVLDRIQDLLVVIQDHVYHPDFRGSFSIKKVLPVLVPDLSYTGLAVANGETAITRFARMARGEISGEQVEITRRQLLAYCKLDTFAMVRLHETLLQLAAGQRTNTP